MKEEIMRLRQQGLTYAQIQDAVGCSKSLISYYCGIDQKEKSRASRERLRSANPVLAKIERFRYKVPGTSKATPTGSKTKRRREMVRSFQRRSGSKLGPATSTFSYKQLVERSGSDVKCYLTGRPVTLTDPDTFSLDHVIPATRGGLNTFENMGVTCPTANWAKTDLSVLEFVTLCCEVVQTFGGVISKAPVVPEEMKLQSEISQ